jgi:internalin A
MSELALKLIKEAKEKRLTRLDLGNCGLTELPEELFELVWLEELILSNAGYKFSNETNEMYFFNSINTGTPNNIKFLSPNLKKLIALKTLLTNGYFGQEWDLKDLSPLQNLYHLRYLDVSTTKINDFEPIKHLINLQALNISYVERFPVLRYVGLLNSYISTSLSPLGNLINLKWLNISSAGVIDLSPLKNLTNLQYLDISGNSVKELTPLQNMKNLKTFKAKFSRKINDITILQNFTQLKEIDLFLTKEFRCVEKFCKLKNYRTILA